MRIYYYYIIHNDKLTKGNGLWSVLVRTWVELLATLLKPRDSVYKHCKLVQNRNVIRWEDLKYTAKKMPTLI